MPEKRKRTIVIADDSYVVRTVLELIIKEQDDMHIVASVANGEEAVKAVLEHHPDILLLDIEMPVMDGIDALRALSKELLATKTIVLSSTTARHAPITIQALALGAAAYLQKPTTQGNKRSIEHVSEELLELIRALVSSTEPSVSKKRSSFISRRPSSVVPPTKERSEPIKDHTAEVIVIGSSTGGPNALSDLFRALPQPLKLPVFIVQHMPKSFLPQLALRLSKESVHKVKVADHDEIVEAGTIYIAPGDIHLTLQKFNGRIRCKLFDGPPEVFCKPSVNPLFRSAASIFKEKTLGIILTGMGEDGLEGARVVKSFSGKLIAQDKDSSVVWGMPRAIVDHNLADEVLPLEEIGRYVRKYDSI